MPINPHWVWGSLAGAFDRRQGNIDGLYGTPDQRYSLHNPQVDPLARIMPLPPDVNTYHPNDIMPLMDLLRMFKSGGS